MRFKVKTSLSTLPGGFLFKWAILVLPLWVGSDRTETSGLLVFNYWATAGLRVWTDCSREGDRWIWEESGLDDKNQQKASGKKRDHQDGGKFL